MLLNARVCLSSGPVIMVQIRAPGRLNRLTYMDITDLLNTIRAKGRLTVYLDPSDNLYKRQMNLHFREVIPEEELRAGGLLGAQKDIEEAEMQKALKEIIEVAQFVKDAGGLKVLRKAMESHEEFSKLKSVLKFVGLKFND